MNQIFTNQILQGINCSAIALTGIGIGFFGAQEIEGKGCEDLHLYSPSTLAVVLAFKALGAPLGGIVVEGTAGDLSSQTVSDGQRAVELTAGDRQSQRCMNGVSYLLFSVGAKVLRDNDCCAGGKTDKKTYQQVYNDGSTADYIYICVKGNSDQSVVRIFFSTVKGAYHKQQNAPIESISYSLKEEEVTL